jgi:hypothetical protein
MSKVRIPNSFISKKMDAVWKQGVTKIGFPNSVLIRHKKEGKSGIFPLKGAFNLFVIKEMQRVRKTEN